MASLAAFDSLDPSLIDGATAVGIALLTAADEEAARDAIGAGTPGGGAAWGDITGTLSAQTDLQTALDGKASTGDVTTVAGDLLTLAGAISTVGYSRAYSDLTGLPTLGTLASQNGTFSGTSSGTNTGDNATNSQYSGLAASKQDTLVSATNIKTINGASILGSGDLTVSAGDPSYSPGSFTVATETGKIVNNEIKLTTTQRMTIEGTGRLSVIT